jgi:hypothetical protein
MKKRRSITAIAVILVLAIALPVAWYLAAPLFIDRTVQESFPESTAQKPAEKTMEESMPEEVVAKATAAMEKAMTEPEAVMEQDVPEDMTSMTILAQGDIYDVAHEGKGTATVYRLGDGSTILRFEEFEVVNGPELHVYLAPDDPVPNNVGVELAGAVDLGLLKGNIGDQNYKIPASLDISQYRSVVIWCQPFRVPFNAAPLVAP